MRVTYCFPLFNTIYGIHSKRAKQRQEAKTSDNLSSGVITNFVLSYMASSHQSS